MRGCETNNGEIVDHNSWHPITRQLSFILVADTGKRKREGAERKGRSERDQRAKEGIEEHKHIVAKCATKGPLHETIRRFYDLLEM